MPTIFVLNVSYEKLEDDKGRLVQITRSNEQTPQGYISICSYKYGGEDLCWRAGPMNANDVMYKIVPKNHHTMKPGEHTWEAIENLVCNLFFLINNKDHFQNINIPDICIDFSLPSSGTDFRFIREKLEDQSVEKKPPQGRNFVFINCVENYTNILRKIGRIGRLYDSYFNTENTQRPVSQAFSQHSRSGHSGSKTPLINNAGNAGSKPPAHHQDSRGLDDIAVLGQN